MERALTWTVAILLLPLGLLVASGPMLIAYDFKETCLQEASEQVMCHDGNPTDAYDVMLWGYPVAIVLVSLVALVGVIVAMRRKQRAWAYPIFGALTIGLLTGFQVWAFRQG